MRVYNLWYMFVLRICQNLQLCFWKTLILKNPWQLIWLLLDFIIIITIFYSMHLLSWTSWLPKKKKFCFYYVSTSGGVLAKYLIMGYNAIYMEGYYCHTLGKWKSLSHVWLFAMLWTVAHNPMDYSLPGSSVHEILQTRILEWVAIPFSRGSSQPRDWTQVSHIPGGFFTVWAHGSPRTLKWVAYPFSSKSSRPRNWTRASRIAGRFSTSWATREALTLGKG